MPEQYFNGIAPQNRRFKLRYVCPVVHYTGTVSFYDVTTCRNPPFDKENVDLTNESLANARWVPLNLTVVIGEMEKLVVTSDNDDEHGKLCRKIIYLFSTAF